MPIVKLTNEECALIHKSIEMCDWNYGGYQGVAFSVQKKVLEGAVKYTKEATNATK